MASWRFYQGLRSEWRWYHFDAGGDVIAESDQGFAELKACMANAEVAGFGRDAYQVHTRQSSEETLVEQEQRKHATGKSGTPGSWSGSPPSNEPEREASHPFPTL